MSARTFPLSGPINLTARLGHGALIVRAVDGLTEATVELDGAPESVERITVEQDGPTLRVIAPRQGGLVDVLTALRPKAGGGGPVTATITVPSGTALDLTSFTASITVEGRSAGASVSSAVGAITLREVDGDLTLRCGTSSLEIGSVSGSVTLRSGSGSARVGHVAGGFEAGCGRGTVTAERVDGPVRWRSGAGEARLNAVFGNVDIATGSGQVSIGLPAGVTAQLDITTGAGSFVSDLPVEQQPASREHVITVRARTGNGDVRLFRAA